MKMTKRIAAMAACAVMAASSMVSIVANASFSSTVLEDCGTIASKGLSFRHMACIDITDGVVTATSNAYEKDGKSFPLYSVYSHVDLYTSSGAWVDGLGCPYYGGKKCTVSVSANTQAGEKYYCIGATAVDTDENGSAMDNVVTYTRATGIIS